MAASQCWFLALLVLGTSWFLVPGRGAVFSNSAGGHGDRAQFGRRRSLLETEQEKPAPVDVAVAVSALLERRLEEVPQEKLQGEVSNEITSLSFIIC